MIIDRGWPVTFSEGMMQAYGEYVDIVKIGIRHIHQPEDVVREKVKMYKKYNVEVQAGGPLMEIGRAEGKGEQVLETLSSLGFDSLEISSEAKPTNEVDEDRKFAVLCKKHGLKIYGEAGKKFPEGDRTRSAPNTLDVEGAAQEIKDLLSMGATKVYFEGHVSRMVLGEMGENKEGGRQIERVAEMVGQDNLIFEVPMTYATYASKRALTWFFVRTFGPEVNLGNISYEELPEAEEIRGGVFPVTGTTGGNHPWLHALTTTGSTEDWWKIKS